jgi:CRISPR-associated protein Cas2
MLFFVIYDISENKSRFSLIKRLQHFGLHRIQKSAFAGNLEFKSKIELIEDIDFYLSSEHDSIIILPICERCKGSIEIFSETEIILPSEEINYKLV